MRKAAAIWLKGLISNPPSYTKEQRREINRFKYLFRHHFEGENNSVSKIPHCCLPIKELGVTDLKFEFSISNVMNVTVVLENPHILSTTMEHLQERLGDGVRLTTKESKLWQYLQ